MTWPISTVKFRILAICALLTVSIAIIPQASAAGAKGTTGWSSSSGNRTGSAVYAWSSGCTKDCNDEVDFEPLITIDCISGSGEAALVFWSIGAESDHGKQVMLQVQVDGKITRLPALGASNLIGVSLDVKLPLDHPLLREMASGKTMTYGSVGTATPKSAAMKGSGKAIRHMLSACR